MSASVDVTVVIPTHDRSAKLTLTLDRLAAQTVTTGWDVLVVANNCTDGTVALVDDRAGGFPVRLTVIEEPTPGAAAARNTGAAKAEGVDVLFLDDDILVEPDCLERIFRDRRQHPGVWLLGQALPLPEHVASAFGAFRHDAMPPVPTEEPITNVRWFASGIALVPRQALLDLGGYDQTFTTAALEDADLAIRAHRAGHSLALDPALTSHHNDWAGGSIRDFCDRARRYCATAPQLERRFGCGDHPWSDLIDRNRPPRWGRDPVLLVARKLLKAVAGTDLSLRALLGVAERLEHVGAPSPVLAPIYRAAIAGSMYAGYREGITDSAMSYGGSKNSCQRALMARQPFPHTVVWRLNETGVRGAARLWRFVSPIPRPDADLVQLPDDTWALNARWDHMARQSYDGGYERAERWVCRRLIRPGGLVLDIGANYGIYTQLAAKLVGPTGKVIAFEPGPALPTLRSIIQRAGHFNVDIVPCAAGGQAGHTTMVVPGHQPALATLRQNAEQLDVRKVEVVRLDDCVAVPDREIDLLKIDTEGYEENVLEGAEGLFDEGRIRAVLLEVSPNFGPIDYIQRLIGRYSLSAYALGYKRLITYRPNLVPYDQHDVRGQVNVLITRTDVAFSPSAR